jgi:hypothetical protein
MENAARPAIPIISDRLQDDNTDVKRAALKTLVAIGPAASDAIPAIIKYMNTAPAADQLVGVQSLGQLGPDARSRDDEPHSPGARSSRS